LRPWALIATGPLRGPRCTPCRRPFSQALLTSSASGRLLPPGPPENLACGPCSTALSGVPLRAPGRTETPDQAIQNNTINKIRGEGSHLTGFVGLTPSPCLSPNRQFTPPKGRLLPSLSGQSTARQPPDRLRMNSARLRPALAELHGQCSPPSEPHPSPSSRHTAAASTASSCPTASPGSGGSAPARSSTRCRCDATDRSGCSSIVKWAVLRTT
ncbi:MAG: hypothetical protein ACI8RZ_002451, partial [Myxococcota bacterium]